MSRLNLFQKKSPAERLADLEATLNEFDGRLANARTQLAEVVAESGNPGTEEARRLMDLISNLSFGRDSVQSAIPRVRAEIEEDERKRLEGEHRRLAKIADGALGEVTDAAAEFDKAAVLMEAALCRFNAAHANAFRAAVDAGGSLASAHIPQRVTSALYAAAPTVYLAVVERLRVGQPLSSGHRIPLAASFPFIPATGGA